MCANCILFATFCSMVILVRRKKTYRYSARKVMEFSQLMADILVYECCKFEMYIFENLCSSYRRKGTYCVSLCTEYIIKFADVQLMGLVYCDEYLVAYVTMRLRLFYHRRLKFCLTNILTRFVYRVYIGRVMRKPTFCYLTWSDTNQAIQLQKMARGLKFRI